MTTIPPIASFLLLLGLGFFFGLAFEEFYAQDGQVRPGGVRSFPLLALAGGLLYRLRRRQFRWSQPSDGQFFLSDHLGLETTFIVTR